MMAPRNPSIVVVVAAACLALTGCVSTGTDALFLPSTATPEGGGQKTGEYPNINNVPAGQTGQLSSGEKAQIRSELSTGTQPAKQQAATNRPATYQRDVAALKAEAEARASVAKDEARNKQEIDAFREEVGDHVKRRKAEIEEDGRVE